VCRAMIVRERKKRKNMPINLKNKKEIVKKYGSNEKDTGSTAVQVAMLSKKISELTEHLKINKKDFSTKRGLLMMVGKRKRLLSYLKNQNLEEYRDLIKKLKIRG
jgi:small subunit ribosomal protein S15